MPPGARPAWTPPELGLDLTPAPVDSAHGLALAPKPPANGPILPGTTPAAPAVTPGPPWLTSASRPHVGRQNQ